MTGEKPPLAEWTTGAIFLFCPHCGEGIEHPQGGYVITNNAKFTPGQIVICTACGKECQIPSIVSSLS